MSRPLRAALALLALLAPLSAARAQVTGRGTEFWACWPRSHLSLETSAEIIVMSDAPTTAEVDGAFVAGPAPVAPGSPWIVAIPETLRIGADRVPVPSGFRVRSLDPARSLTVTLRVPRQAEASDDTARLLPVTELGTQYLVSSFQASLPGEPSLLAVVATEDGTNVSVTLPCTGPVNATLNRGEAWQLFCDWRAVPPDVTGAEVAADRPVAVFAGASDAFVPADWLSGDFILEQATPLASWGSEHVVAPLPKGPRAVPGAHDVVRVIASAAGTLEVNDGSGPQLVALAGPGSFVDIRQAGPLHLRADVAVDVHQFATGVEMTDLGDPFMTQVPALSHWGTGARAYIPAYYSLGNYVTLMTASAATASARLDGAAVIGWQPMPDGVHSWAMVDVGTLPGERVVACDAPIGVIAHGYNAEYLPEPGLGRTPGSHGTPAAHATPPCVVVAVTDAPATSCAGATLRLREGGSTATSCSGLEYRWLQDGVEIPGCGWGASASCDVLFRDEALYTLEARCLDDPACVGAASQRVANQPPPPVSITPDPVETCAGVPVLLEGSVGFVIYAWTSNPPDPGVTPSSSALPTLRATPEVDTTYTLAALDVRGCVSADTVRVTVTPDPLPPALGASVRVTKSGNDAIIAWEDLTEPWRSYETVVLECSSRDWRVACPGSPPHPVNIQAAPLAAPAVAPGVERLIHAGALDRGDLLFYKVRATSLCAGRPGPTCNPWPRQVPACP